MGCGPFGPAPVLNTPSISYAGSVPTDERCVLFIPRFFDEAFAPSGGDCLAESNKAEGRDRSRGPGKNEPGLISRGWRILWVTVEAGQSVGTEAFQSLSIELGCWRSSWLP